jgi:hypothetical protein
MPAPVQYNIQKFEPVDFSKEGRVGWQSAVQLLSSLLEEMPCLLTINSHTTSIDRHDRPPHHVWHL